MKRISILILLSVFFQPILIAQDIIPKVKTKEERKAEKKNRTLQEKIDDISATVGVKPPTASITLPGEEKITSLEDAKKYMSENVPIEQFKKLNEKRKTKKKIKEEQEEIFNGKAYYGIPVEKKQYRRGSGQRMVVRDFYILEGEQKTNPYIRDLFWWDDKNQRVVQAVSRDKENNTLMHGPYKEYVGENLVEEGYYYLGTKDGRWVSYDRDFNLVDKATYNRGFLDGSKFNYFNGDSSKLKEVIPNSYGKETGPYFLFHPDGTMALEGNLDGGVRVGKWVEYYQGGNRRKKEIQYGTDLYDETKSYVIREYDEGGKIIYENEKVKR